MSVMDDISKETFDRICDRTGLQWYDDYQTEVRYIRCVRQDATLSEEEKKQIILYMRMQLGVWHIVFR